MSAANKQTAENLRIGEGAAGPGRPKGSSNRVSTVLREAILLAAEQQGEDGTGKGGLTGYCRFLAQEEPRAFAALLGRVLPLHVGGEDGGPIQTVTMIELVAAPFPPLEGDQS